MLSRYRDLLLVFCCLIGAFSLSSAQQIPRLSNGLDNLMFANPAISSINPHLEIRGTYRTQWTSIDDSPTNQLLGFTKGFDTIPFGFGLMLSNDQAGKLNNTGGMGMFSYAFNNILGEASKISLGLGVGVSQWSLNSNEVIISNPDDPSVDALNDGSFAPMLNLGLAIQKKGLLVSLSSPQVLEYEASFKGEMRDYVNDIKRHLFATAAYSFPLSESLTLQPAVHARSFQNAPLQVDVGARIFLRNFWLGGWFRPNESISGQFGLSIKGLGLYYAYDATSSNLSNVSGGTHEVGLGYIFRKNTDRDGDGVPDEEDDCPDEPGEVDNNGCPKNDRDGDGIADEDDDCPDVAGLEKFNGCPDTDGDGIIDKEDKCPKEPGKPENFGCPDTDGDGIPDINDDCPKLFGPEENNGCPDSDGDGLHDGVDSCPKVAGPIENKGCPWLDSDGDGLTDNIDRCPTIPGPESNGGCPVQAIVDSDGDGIPDDKDDCPNTRGSVDNNGCPKVSKQEYETIYLALVNLEFEFDKAIIVQTSLPYLEQLADLMVKKPDWKLRIAGHTDSIGPDDYNMKLSRDRSFAIRNYLMSRGMSVNQFAVEYYGESKPIDTNETEEGRQRNRRVEMEFIFD